MRIPPEQRDLLQAELIHITRELGGVRNAIFQFGPAPGVPMNPDRFASIFWANEEIPEDMLLKMETLSKQFTERRDFGVPDYGFLHENVPIGTL